jgi:hypothetical protein
MDRRKAIVFWLMVFVIGVVVWRVISTINEGEVSGKVYEVENGKICLSGGGLWEFNYHGDNYPEVGRWVTVRYENGNTIASWCYREPPGLTKNRWFLMLCLVCVVLLICSFAAMKK